MRNASVKIVFLLFLSLFQIHVYASGDDRAGFSRGHAAAFASAQEEKPDIEWFRKETGIASKYMEQESGVMGLSWAHFLTLVFLALSFVVALVALILRYRRTKELLRLILKEESKNDREG